MGIMSWVGSMLGSSNIVDKLVDEVVNSKDEKSRILATQRLDSLSQFKVVQRLLVASAMLVFIPTALSMLACVLLGYNDKLEQLIMICQEPMIYYPVGACFTAYLGSGTIESFKRKNLNESSK